MDILSKKKKNMLMVNKHVKRHSTSLFIRKCKLSHSEIPLYLRKGLNKNPDIPKGREDMEPLLNNTSGRAIWYDSSETTI